MTRLATAVLVIGAFATANPSSSPSHRAATVKALVGGTLVDGFGGTPIRKSVVLIAGERITAVGQVGGDVLRHIALLQRVDVVVKRGTRYK